MTFKGVRNFLKKIFALPDEQVEYTFHMFDDTGPHITFCGYTLLLETDRITLDVDKVTCFACLYASPGGITSAIARRLI